MDISGWIQGFFSQIGDLLGEMFEKILSILPDSPFQALSSIPEVQEVLGYVNYFVPISFFLSVLQLWLAAIGVFYLWQVILRLIKAIE